MFVVNLCMLSDALATYQHLAYYYSVAAKLAAKNTNPRTIITQPTIGYTNRAKTTPTSVRKTPPVRASSLGPLLFRSLKDDPVGLLLTC